MKYTLCINDCYYAREIYRDFVLGYFISGEFSKPIQYISLSKIRTALKTRGIPQVYIYREEHIKEFKIVPKTT